MNIHEYQAKELLKRYGVAVPDGHVAWTPDEAVEAARKLPGPVYVVKSQFHAGGRGAGRFADDPNGKGGVRLARSLDEVRAHAEAMIGHTLITKQTGPAGRPVHRVYVEAGCDIARELYLSLLVDRVTGRITVVASTEGGMEIEEVAAHQPEKIQRVAIDPQPVFPPSMRGAWRSASASGAQVASFAKLLPALYAAFTGAGLLHHRDQPVGGQRRRRGDRTGRQGQLRRQRAVPPSRTGKAARRGGGRSEGTRSRQVQPQLRGAGRQYRLHGERRRPCHGDDGHHQAVRRVAGELPRCRRRRDEGKGDRGVQDHPVGSERRRHPGQHLRRHHALRRDRRRRGRRPRARCSLSVPLVVRLEGTNVDLGKAILAKSNLPIIAADNLADAAEKIVKAVQEAG